MKALAEEGHIFIDDAHEVHLTLKRQRIGEDTYERHNTFWRLLRGLGVDEKTAASDACEMEHAVSVESYEVLKRLTDLRKDTEMEKLQIQGVPETMLQTLYAISEKGEGYLAY